MRILKRSKIAVALLLVAGVIGGTGAYLTDKSDILENTFRFGTVNLTLEDNLVGSDTMNLTPLSVIKRQPNVRNIDNKSSYVSVNVEIPYLNVEVVNEDGKSVTKEKQPLYTFEVANNNGYTWNKTGEKISDSGDTIIYSYVYGKIENGVFKKKELLGGEVTECPIFNEIQLKNIVEGEVPDTDIQSVSIEIQS